MLSLRVWLSIGLVAGLIIFGYVAFQKVKHYGYELAQIEFMALREEQERKQAIELQAKQDEVLEVEKELLATDRETVVEYRYREVETEKEVVRYVEVNSLGDCRIGDDGMQQVNRALSRATENSNPEQPLD